MEKLITVIVITDEQTDDDYPSTEEDQYRSNH